MIKFSEILKEMKPIPGGKEKPVIRKLGNIGLYIEIDKRKFSVVLDKDMKEELIAIKTFGLEDGKIVKDYLNNNGIPFNFIEHSTPHLFIIRDTYEYFNFQK